MCQKVKKMNGWLSMSRVNSRRGNLVIYFENEQNCLDKEENSSPCLYL